MLKSELPDHAFLSLIENVLAIGDAPEPRKFPSVDSQFVKKRHRLPCFDGIEKRSVCCVKLLVAVTPRPRVIDNVCCASLYIRVAGIYPPKIGQE